MEPHPPNELIRETSPYLLQHAHNPVQWVAWNDQTLARAREEDKPLLISIGYAACHWCHVMERECFEDPGVAEVMNTLFIPVKVDREERPDVDQIYMDALQIMTGSGGWPLNVVALPDGRPFWGATYLPRDRWMQVLVQLGRLYRDDHEKVREYASDLSSAVSRINLPGAEPDTDLPDPETLSGWVADWKPRFDAAYGGMQGAPKFMMPVLLEFLLHWGEATADTEVRQHVLLTLKSMAHGGLFDQLGGGFSRYSVDTRWHVPHFEKMGYDNAQLLSLYARAYAAGGDTYFREIAAETIRFLTGELRSPEGAYYASLDADSTDSSGKLEEGAFYTWREKELRELLGDDFRLFAEMYNINAYGRWEGDRYVLIRKESDAALAARLEIGEAELRERVDACRDILLKERNRRDRPRLDDKVIASWNGLVLAGLSDAWRYCSLEAAQSAALELGAYLAGTLVRGDGSLPHASKKGKGRGNGFLEDYAALADGFIRLYEASGDTTWMGHARALCRHALEYFAEPGQPLLYYTSRTDPALIRRTLETADNVIPSSNSIMAKNLFRLGHFYDLPDWRKRSRDMLAAVTPSAARYSTQYSNWMQLALWHARPYCEVAVCGPDAAEKAATIRSSYQPHILLAVSDTRSDLPLFEGRFQAGTTRIYICREGQCLQPLEDSTQALGELRGLLTD